MEVPRVLHMNKGAGETSYAKNSTVQSQIISIAKPVTKEAVLKCLDESINQESMGIADLGCSSGPNTLVVISDIIDTIHAKCCSLGRSSPEFRLFLNDLFNNDFNGIFASLPAFYNRIREKNGIGLGRCLIFGVPGSFYGRLFPKNSLHFVHSSSSLHWLSQVPPALESNARTALNKGKIYLSNSSPQCVLEAYSKQFQEDFSLFLRSRSEEIVAGGRMVLSFMGRSSSDPTTEGSCYQWELLSLALMSMVNEGLVKEEKVDSFNAPYYAPCPEELKLEVEREGSFIVERLEALPIDWDGGIMQEFSTCDPLEVVSTVRGQQVAKAVRAVVESMLESHFGPEIMDDLFQRYQEMVGHYLSKSNTKYTNLVVSLMKRA